jgi:chemotaxis protein methyltransferase CheR
MRSDTLPDTLYARLAEFIAAKTGLSFPPERRTDLQRCLLDAAVDFDFPDVVTCAEWLLSSPLTPAQLNTLATHLTIGETYFFRERKVFDALVRHVLPELIQRRRGRHQSLRLWSAACSTGEEPYSLAIALEQLLPDWHDWQVTLLATDINTRSLRRAATGVYGEWSFRESDSAFKRRYFSPTADQRLAVLPQIRQRVSFAQLNLAADEFPPQARAMDVIFCRNLLIYFTPAHARKLVDKLCDALSDDGWLVVSPTECSQSLFSQLTPVNFPGAILYQKSARKRPIEPLPIEIELLPIIEAPAAAAPVARPPRPSAEELYRQGCYPELIDTLLSLDQAALQPAALSLLARAFANQGKLRDALVWCQRWIAADKLDAGAHYLHGTILMELSEWAAARYCLQRAIYLQPDFVVAHLALGNCARGDARKAEASRHFANALRLARARPADEPLPESDGLTAGRLTEIITIITSGERNARA